MLRDVYARDKYRDVILPMTVFRRLDAFIEPTREAVFNTKNRLEAAGISNLQTSLYNSAEQAFYNISSFTLRPL